MRDTDEAMSEIRERTSASGDGNIGTSALTPGHALSRLDRFLREVPFYPLLLAAYPALLLFSNNLAEVDAREIVLPLTVILLVTTVALGALSWLSKSKHRAALVVTAAVVPCLAYGYIVDVFEPFSPGSLLIRSQLMALLAWAVVFLFSVSLAIWLSRRLPALTQAMNVAAVVLIVLVLWPVGAYALWPANSADHRHPVLAASEVVDIDRPKRDVYHLVFDRYGSEAALRAGHGIDNSEFIDWLRRNGFQVVDDARANYWRTLHSMSSTFAMSLHDDLASEMGAGNPNPWPLLDLMHNNPAGATLQQLGYQYLHYGSWIRFLKRSDIADQVGNPELEVSYSSTLIENSAIPITLALMTLATSGPETTLMPWARALRSQLDLVESAAQIEGPKYVFAHFLLPHDPYVFLADGTFAPREASYETQLRFANAQIRRLVEPLLAQPEEQRPIIIIQADEGPYPERYRENLGRFDWSDATDEEFASKFGVISAWYLPGVEGEPPIRAGTSLVNTYPEILTRYFGLDVPRAPDRSYIQGGGPLYAHVNITDRVIEAIDRFRRPGPSG